MKLGNPKAQDTPQINLVLDGGIKGTKVKTVSPDTNRDDPIAGAALGSLTLLMFPKSLKNLGFECFVITSAGLFVQSMLVAIAHPIVWITSGLLLLMAMLYIMTAMLNHPQCTLSGLSKLVLFTVGVLLCAIVVF
jgi:hypothetical protein